MSRGIERRLRRIEHGAGLSGHTIIVFAHDAETAAQVMERDGIAPNHSDKIVTFHTAYEHRPGMAGTPSPKGFARVCQP